MTAPDPAMLGAMTSPAADPDCASVPAGELAAFGLLMERTQKALAAERERAERAEAELAALGGRISAVIAQAVAAERDRIRQLAVRNGAVCTGDEGTSCYFADLIGEPTEAAAEPRIAVDLNVRVRGHETYSGFDDVTGADPASLQRGGRVIAFEAETGIFTHALVTTVDPVARLVFLLPDWPGFRDDPAVEEARRLSGGNRDELARRLAEYGYRTVPDCVRNRGPA